MQLKIMPGNFHSSYQVPHANFFKKGKKEEKKKSNDAFSQFYAEAYFLS